MSGGHGKKPPPEPPKEQPGCLGFIVVPVVWAVKLWGAISRRPSLP